MPTRNKLLISLGKKVRSYREARGLTQEQLGEKATLDPTYISGIERGVRNPSIVSLERLARALGVPISDLLSGIDN